MHCAQQPRSEWPSNVLRSNSAVGKASTIGIEILPIPPLIFTVGSESAKFGVVSNASLLWAARVWKCSKISERWYKILVWKWSPYVLAKIGEFVSTHSWELFGKSAPPPKIAQRKLAKSSITQRWIIRFRSNCVQSLNAWHPKCCKSSSSRGHRSRSQHDITCAIFRKIINNSAGDCSISLTFRTDLFTWRLMYHELSRPAGQRPRSHAAWHNVSP